MAETSPVDLLDRALTQSTELFNRVTPEQLDWPTPCADWALRDLLRHMVGGVRNFRAVVAGEPMQSFDIVVDDAALSGEFRQEAAGLMAAWREEGVLDRRMTMFGGEMPAVFPLSLQITEEALHGWDMARAIGHGEALDDEIAEFALAFAERNMVRNAGASLSAPRAKRPLTQVPTSASRHSRVETSCLPRRRRPARRDGLRWRCARAAPRPVGGSARQRGGLPALLA